MPNAIGRELRDMGNAEGTQASLCMNCGTALIGPFCSGCGSPVDAPAKGKGEGWGALTSEFISAPKRDGIFAVAVSFLRHPIRTILRLTDDPTYRSHWSFLTACVGAQLTLVYVALPRLYSALLNLPDAASSSAVITNEIVQYVGMAILTPIQYYVCRALGSIRRTPMSYVKLCVLSVSYGALLSIVFALFYFAISIIDLKTVAILELDEFWTALAYLSMAAILTFVTAAHRRFWGMSWLAAIAATMIAAALSWLVVYPGLTSLVEQAKIGETIANLLG
jgi:hypothetical protein